jgi:hypothetical protein
MESDLSYYDIGSDEAQGPSPPAQGATEGGETALIPKSLFQGREFKPDEIISLKVVHLFEDEVEVQPVFDKTEKPETEDEMESDMEETETSASERSPEEQLESIAVSPSA